MGEPTDIGFRPGQRIVIRKKDACRVDFARSYQEDSFPPLWQTKGEGVYDAICPSITTALELVDNGPHSSATA
nr:hypothetical protein [Ralstonia solanacearum]